MLSGFAGMRHVPDPDWLEDCVGHIALRNKEFGPQVRAPGRGAQRQRPLGHGSACRCRCRAHTTVVLLVGHKRHF